MVSVRVGILGVHIIYIHRAPEVTLRELEFWPVTGGRRLGACWLRVKSRNQKGGENLSLRPGAAQVTRQKLWTKRKFYSSSPPAEGTHPHRIQF